MRKERIERWRASYGSVKAVTASCSVGVSVGVSVSYSV